MEDSLLHFIRDHHLWTYPIILLWTFVEGETIVILCAAASMELGIPVELLALTAFLGSFLGDQTYYNIGRRYGAPLLMRWPKFEERIDWAFQLVKDHPTAFILSFRFIYGIRNLAPFVIGISGVPRMKYLVLNLIAAMIWAHSFAWGGRWVGRELEIWLGPSKWVALGAFFVLALAVGIVGYMRRKKPVTHRAIFMPEEEDAPESTVQAMSPPDAAA